MTRVEKFAAFIGIGVFAAVLLWADRQASPADSAAPRASTPVAAAPMNPLLELRAFTWQQTETGNYAIVSAQVRNVSDAPIESLKAVVSFYAIDGTFIKSDIGYVEYRPLMPGQLSPVEVMSSWNPMMSKATIEFSSGSRVIAHSDVTTGRRSPCPEKSECPPDR